MSGSVSGTRRRGRQAVESEGEEEVDRLSEGAKQVTGDDSDDF